jgi:hypothetical protein
MTKTNFTRLPREHAMRSKSQRVAEGLGAAILLLMTGIATSQNATPTAPAAPVAAHPNVQNGFVVHETVDLGGHIAGIVGSGAMYDTLVNIHTGPRVLGETFTLHALPGSKHALLDSLTAFSNGFGGDPNNYAKLDFSKGKLYEATSAAIASTSTMTFLPIPTSRATSPSRSAPRISPQAPWHGRRWSSRR